MKTVYIIQAMGDWLKPSKNQPHVTNFYWSEGIDNEGQFIRKLKVEDDKAATFYSTKEMAEEVIEKIKQQGLLLEGWTIWVGEIEVEDESIKSPKILLGHDCFENAYIQPDYPYGRSLRCKRALWIETATKGSQKGNMRLCYRTTNPKAKKEVWNSVHNEQYREFLIMYFDSSTGYVLTDSPGRLAKNVEEFKDRWYHQLSEDLKKKFDGLERRYIPINSTKKVVSPAVVDANTDFSKLTSQQAFALVEPIFDTLSRIASETTLPVEWTIVAQLKQQRLEFEPIKQAYYSSVVGCDPKIPQQYEEGLKKLADLEQSLAQAKEQKRKMQIARRDRITAFAKKHYQVWIDQELFFLYGDSRGFETPYTWNFENWYNKIVQNAQTQNLDEQSDEDSTLDILLGMSFLDDLAND